MAADVLARAKAAVNAKNEESANAKPETNLPSRIPRKPQTIRPSSIPRKPKPAPMGPINRSKRIAVNKNLKRASYSPKIVKFVMGLRAASYKMGGTDLAYLFNEIDVDKSGSLDAAEFAKVLRRFVSMNVTDFSASV